MGRRHQRHALRGVSRAIKQLDSGGVWTVTGLPHLSDQAIDIKLAYTGAGSGTVTLYTVPRATPTAAETAALMVAFAGAGNYELTGGLGADVYPSRLADSLATLGYSLL